jgi:hypothetical protein
VRPSDFLICLWGDEPPGRIQLWRLSDHKAMYPISPMGADSHRNRPDVFTCVALTWPRRTVTAAGRPRAEHAVALAGLWLDIDITRDGKPGVPDQQAGVQLAGKVLDPTILVNSGYGVHAWYLLDEPWKFISRDDQATATRLAADWYALHAEIAAQRSWHLDVGTRDLARLMRLPGTLNAKHEPHVPVTVLEQTGRRYTLDQLRQAAPPADSSPARTALTDSPAGKGDPPGPTVISCAVGPAPAQLIALLRDQDPEFAAAWIHDVPGRAHWTMSEWDLSLASRMVATGKFTDQLVASVLVAHRLAGNPGDPKAHRVDYLQRTIAKARAEREAA